MQQEKLIAELNVLTKVINEAIIKEGAGYKGKVQGLDKYKELYWVKEEGGKPEPSPPLTLDTLYGMRGKVINKIRPRVDHLMKSSVVSHKNRKEYFGFIQNVLDRANAMDLTTSSKELPGIAKSLNRVQAIEQIVEEAKKPAREKKRNTPEKKSIEVEDINNEHGIPWQVVYGISNNTRAFWSIANARKVFGYDPKDDSEILFSDWIKKILVDEGKLG